jgi:hypothetical protein
MTNYHHNIVGSEALERRSIVPGYGAVRLSRRRDGFWTSKTFALLLLIAVGAGVLGFALMRRGLLVL